MLPTLEKLTGWWRRWHDLVTVGVTGALKKRNSSAPPPPEYQGTTLPLYPTSWGFDMGATSYTPSDLKRIYSNFSLTQNLL